jgi:hypothetical protein
LLAVMGGSGSICARSRPGSSICDGLSHCLSCPSSASPVKMGCCSCCVFCRIQLRLKVHLEEGSARSAVRAGAGRPASSSSASPRTWRRCCR